MHLPTLFILALISNNGFSLPISTPDDPTNWYSDSAGGVAVTLEDRDTPKNTNWYSDSSSGVANQLEDRKAEEKTTWYSDSASGVANALSTDKRSDTTNWYTDSASGSANLLDDRSDEKTTNWYSDSASGVAESLSREKRNEKTNWYSDSASGVVNQLEERKQEERDAEESTNWYIDSAAGVAKSLDNRDDKEKTNWYSDSAAGVAESLSKRDDAKQSDWYSDSASGMAEALAKRDGLNSDEKESYEKALRDWIYFDMRAKALRDSSERGKAFFEFTPKPRNDFVDRWHVPVELQARFNATDSDAERVSILNYYLMVTGREPKSAKELGFTPTADAPGLTETNEVGYGYALAGQHQYHCVNFVADAIDIGKAGLNDFFLKHTIHCLGLLKWLSPQLTMKQPNSFLLRPANDRLLEHYPQTKQGITTHLV